MSSRVYVRCLRCNQPRKFGFATMQRAQYAFPRLRPDRDFILDRDPRGKGLPPVGYRDFCSCEAPRS